MVFDSPQVQSLLRIYETEPDFMVPEIVFLARTEKLENERIYIEDLFARASEIKQRDWLGRLVSNNHQQFRSVWFEIMLFGWLQNLGSVEIEPSIEGNYPDFSIELNGYKIIVEARAILDTITEREQTRFEAGIFWALKQIAKPYLIEIVDAKSSTLPNWINFQKQVIHWLDSNPDEKFVFESETTIIVLRTSPMQSPNQKSVSAFTNPGMFQKISSDPIKRPLREKAHQHSKLRKANYPYIIALYLESWYLSAEEVAKAWLGEEVWTVNFEKKEVVETYSNQSGIHFSGSEIRHTTVSGTLVFRSEWTESEKCSYLRAWYVENPFAKVALDSRLFPVEARYVVTDKSTKGFRMAWMKS
jgi:hypothetical protein